MVVVIDGAESSRLPLMLGHRKPISIPARALLAARQWRAHDAQLPSTRRRDGLRSSGCRITSALEMVMQRAAKPGSLHRKTCTTRHFPVPYRACLDGPRLHGVASSAASPGPGSYIRCRGSVVDTACRSSPRIDGGAARTCRRCNVSGHRQELPKRGDDVAAAPPRRRVRGGYCWSSRRVTFVPLSSAAGSIRINGRFVQHNIRQSAPEVSHTGMTIPEAQPSSVGQGAVIDRLKKSISASRARFVPPRPDDGRRAVSPSTAAGRPAASHSSAPGAQHDEECRSGRCRKGPKASPPPRDVWDGAAERLSRRRQLSTRRTTGFSRSRR